MFNLLAGSIYCARLHLPASGVCCNLLQTAFLYFLFGKKQCTFLLWNDTAYKGNTMGRFRPNSSVMSALFNLSGFYCKQRRILYICCMLCFAKESFYCTIWFVFIFSRADQKWKLYRNENVIQLANINDPLLWVREQERLRAKYLNEQKYHICY